MCGWQEHRQRQQQQQQQQQQRLSETGKLNKNNFNTSIDNKPNVS